MSLRQFSKIINNNLFKNTKRKLIIDPNKLISCDRSTTYNYEGHGKTTATFIDEEFSKFLMVDSVNEFGFSFANGPFASGPIILFPSFIFQWKVKTIDDITPESLILFQMIEPRIELLILGIGHTKYWSAKSLNNLQKTLKQLTNLKIEIMPTRDAVTTYNFMLSDYRLIGGAFLPLPKEIDMKLIDSNKF
ncbi:pre-rRNA-processing protein TSR1 [Sarcoptes scabiei]|uniref:NADH dehydrogenase [ubiquinone] 1 alpha subcomplex assembly factor 3 n=2 Tax=Sarcoptes scabiei TaxID=52283 RepID=A0A834REI3_SARSC|nr:pre-rRNA-processing protein TSR1 [Sarcoptes scabiei]